MTRSPQPRISSHILNMVARTEQASANVTVGADEAELHARASAKVSKCALEGSRLSSTCASGLPRGRLVILEEQRTGCGALLSSNQYEYRTHKSGLSRSCSQATEGAARLLWLLPAQLLSAVLCVRCVCCELRLRACIVRKGVAWCADCARRVVEDSRLSHQTYLTAQRKRNKTLDISSRVYGLRAYGLLLLLCSTSITCHRSPAHRRDSVPSRLP